MVFGAGKWGVTALLLGALAAAPAVGGLDRFVGSPAPAFSLPDQAGVVRQLADYRGRWLVLFFYPKNDTPGCTTEACNFRDGHVQFRTLGAEVVGVSVDDTASHLAFARKHSLPFTLLADSDGQVAARYGALTDLKVVRFAKRHTFLIDPEGVVRQRWTEVDPDTHAAEVASALKALRTAR